MPCRYCKTCTCRNPLHADDTHAECVSRLGKSHADAALSRAECSHCKCFSLASVLAVSFLFRERLRPSRSSVYSPHFYTMHGCGSLPSVTDGNPHTQLPRRLAHSGPVAGGFNIAQDPPPLPLGLPGLRVNFVKCILSPSQRISFLFWLKQGVTLDTVHRRKVVMTDASNKVFGPRRIRGCTTAWKC